ncbi:hypothetical protein EC991_007467, partial [Linnemannia zychae]
MPSFEVLSIPELLDAIRVFLTLHELAQCTAVSKTFQALFTPFLWEIISIKTHHQHDVFTTVPEVQDALVRNAIHVRAIYLRTCKSLEPFFQVDPSHLKLLHTLAFPWVIESRPALRYVSETTTAGNQQPLQHPDDDPISPASSVYFPLSPLSLQDQGLAPQPRISFDGGFDRVVAQKDWLRAKGMYLGQEQMIQSQLRHLDQLLQTRRQILKAPKKMQQCTTAAAPAPSEVVTLATPASSTSSSSSSSTASG